MTEIKIQTTGMALPSDHGLRCGKWKGVKFLKSPDSKRALGKITNFDAEKGIATIVLNKSGKRWKDSLPKGFSCGYKLPEQHD